MRLIAHHQRNPELRRIRLRADEFARGDPDDRIGLSGELERFADDAWICIEAPLPETITQHHHRMLSQPAIFFRQERSSQGHLRSEEHTLNSSHLGISY